jgi:hypothetical protein
MSATDKDKIVVNINSQSRMYEIVATLLAIGAVGMIAYALAQNGWLEIAATMLTMFLTQLMRLLFANGLLKMPEGGTKKGDFQGTAGFVRTALTEFKAWQSRSPIWRLAALAAGYTLLFMAARAAMTWALGVFTNVWVAGAAAALLGALIIFPQLFSRAFRTVSGKLSAPSTEGDDTTAAGAADDKKEA